ncbi:aminotransferase class V-fold PLP-dependent enzyme [Nocardioides sp.]|uniref:aminotransferase class V-fold PLP-dependent enzyme n=1 Tax=Nocardioides sp. TaxID=35761 RepID=UPI0039E4A0DD
MEVRRRHTQHPRRDPLRPGAAVAGGSDRCGSEHALVRRDRVAATGDGHGDDATSRWPRRRRHRAGIARAESVDGLAIYGPPAGAPRSPLAAFNIDGVDPFQLARQLGREGIEARAGCHCATLAHRDLGLEPPASCRLSFAVYSSHDDVLRAVEGVRGVAQRLRRRHGSGFVNVG